MNIESPVERMIEIIRMLVFRVDELTKKLQKYEDIPERHEEIKENDEILQKLELLDSKYQNNTVGIPKNAKKN